jgi:hypothetical protein
MARHAHLMQETKKTTFRLTLVAAEGDVVPAAAVEAVEEAVAVVLQARMTTARNLQRLKVTMPSVMAVPVAEVAVAVAAEGEAAESMTVTMVPVVRASPDKVLCCRCMGEAEMSLSGAHAV